VNGRLLLALAGALLLCTPHAGGAQPPDAAQTVARPFDPEAATQAYLDRLPPGERAGADDYVEGGYWLRLWYVLLVVGVNLGLLATGASRRMRDRAERLVRVRPARTFAYVVQYFVVTTLLVLPMTIYEGFIREHQYGLSNQSFAAWSADHAKALGVGLLLGGLTGTALYGVVRRLPRSWPLWGASAAIGFVIVGALVSPVYIDPLFNEYTRLTDPVVSASIQRMARVQGVAADDVWVFDASRQTRRVSANVSGFAGTLRIRLNDNLLNRASMAEIEAVMGHEIGHYVLNHVYKFILFFGVLVVIGFALLKWGFERVAAGPGAAWGLCGPGDVAGLPLAVAIISAYSFVLAPVLNSYVRIQESEADLFGINASGQPDGEALVNLTLGEYRKLDPGPIEEILFFDHPSGRSRILMAMRWKAEHLAEAEANRQRAAETDRRRGWSTQSAEEWAREHEPK
jgi:STE24 endopeptidase